MQSSQIYDLVIVGAGPVGLFAAFYARMRELRTLILDTLPEPGGQLTALYPEKLVYDVPGFSTVLARDLAANLYEQAQSDFVSWQLGRKVDVLRRDNELWHIGASDGEIYCSRTVLMTAGVGSFTPNPLGLAKEADYVGKGLYYFARDFAEFDNQDVIIVGGGDSAVDWSLSLVERARSLKLIHRSAAFRAHEANLHKLRQSRATILAPATISELHGTTKLEAVTLQQGGAEAGERVPCSRLVLALGFKAEVGSIVAWGFELEKNKIVVDALGATNLPGVYAAGDIAFHPEIGNLKLMVVGFGQAAIAVSSAHIHINPTGKLFAGHSSAMKSLQKSGAES